MKMYFDISARHCNLCDESNCPPIAQIITHSETHTTHTRHTAVTYNGFELFVSLAPRTHVSDSVIPIYLFDVCVGVAFSQSPLPPHASRRASVLPSAVSNESRRWQQCRRDVAERGHGLSPAQRAALELK